MSDASNDLPKHAKRADAQDGAVRDVDEPTADDDTTSGGAPEEPDKTVYDGHSEAE